MADNIEVLEIVNPDLDDPFDVDFIHVATLDGGPGSPNPNGDFTILFTYVHPNSITADFSGASEVVINSNNKRRAIVSPNGYETAVQRISRFRVF